MNRPALGVGAGMLAGVLAISVLRFAFAPLASYTHYHANFALFIDGERVDLSAPRYMEDVGACRADPSAIHPKDRVHMHDGNHDVVHVHHGGATWGHFFTNIGWGLGPDYLVTHEGRILRADGTVTFQARINGRPAFDVHNRLIESEDRLLLSYGETTDEELEARFERVASNAGEFNTMADPATCAGHGELTVWERLKKAVWN